MGTSSVLLAVTLIATAPWVATAVGQESLGDVYRGVRDSTVAVLVTQEARGTEKEVKQSAGTGVVLTAEGRVLTSARLVQTADKVEVQVPGGELLPATVWSADTAADVALLQVYERLPESVTPMTPGAAASVEAGDEIFVVGVAQDERSLLVGRVSGRRQRQLAAHLPESPPFLELDVTVLSGHAGAPVFSRQGVLIGIISHVAEGEKSSREVAYAATSDIARERLLDRPPFWGGADLLMVDDLLGRLLNIPAPHAGLLVIRVAKGSRADRLGLKGGAVPATLLDQPLVLGGDIIVEILGMPVERERTEEISQGIRDLPEGGVLRLKVLRGGRIVDLSG